MRRFEILVTTLLLGLFLVGFAGCGGKDEGWREPAKMHWDRDMCDRCKMAISERKFAVQVIDPKTHKHYKFDDIGCAIKWMQENDVPWKDRAIVWVTDAKTGKWIDARKAYWASGKISPMGFGFGAYEKREDAGAHPLSFDEVVKKIEAMKRMRMGHHR